MQFVAIPGKSTLAEEYVVISGTGLIGVECRVGKCQYNGSILPGEHDSGKVQYKIGTPDKNIGAGKGISSCYNFRGIKSIKRSSLSPHFDQDKIYKYKTYTEAFYDIFELQGDTIVVKSQSSSSSSNDIVESINKLELKQADILITLTAHRENLVNKQVELERHYSLIKTTQLLVDTYREPLTQSKALLNECQILLTDQQLTIDDHTTILSDQEHSLCLLRSSIDRQQTTLDKLQTTLDNIQQYQVILDGHQVSIDRHQSTINNHENSFEEHRKSLIFTKNTLGRHQTTLGEHQTSLEHCETILGEHQTSLEHCQKLGSDYENTAKCLQVQLIRYQHQMKVRDNILITLTIAVIIMILLHIV